MSIETIIIIILALLVLVIIAASFSGGMAALWKKIIGISETTTEITLTDAQTQCTNLCKTPGFASTTFFVKDIGSKTCAELVTCPTPTV